MAYSPRKRLDLIRELVNANKLKDARRRLTKFVPARLDRYERGYYYFLQGRFDLLDAVYRVQNVNHAIRLLSEFAPADDLCYWAKLLKGVLLRRAHRWKRAVAVLEQLVREAPDAGHYHVGASAIGQLAWHAAVTGNFRKADRLFTAAIDRYHFEAVRHHRRAMIHNRATWHARYGRFADADGAYLADPLSKEEMSASLAATFTINQAFGLALRRRTDAALHMLDKLFDPRKADAGQYETFWLNRGITLLMAARYDDALDDLAKGMSMTVESRRDVLATYHKWIALCHLQLGDFNLARSFARMALKRGQRNNEPFEIGGSFFVLGCADALDPEQLRRKRARRHLERAIEVFQRIEAKWDLAMVQYRAAHLRVFETREETRMIRQALDYFRAEKIKPPRKLWDRENRILNSLGRMNDDDRNDLKHLLGID